MHRSIFAALLAAALAPLTAPALVLYDFEQAYYVEALENQCKDHAVVYHDSLYHVYYIESLPQEPGEYNRTERWLRHITSPDLRHWTRHDSILPVVPDSWEEKFIWAPKIIEEDGGWRIYYTGADEDVCQQIGVAHSSDLWTWTRDAENPVFKPGRWAQWQLGEWSNCRDPEVYYDPDSLSYYMLATATTIHDEGAIALSTSADGLDWPSNEWPFLVNDTDMLLESPVLLRDDLGWYHLMFHEQDSGGTAHMYSDSLLSGWDVEAGVIVDWGRGAEVTWANGGWLFSRYNGLPMEDGWRFFLKFDRMDFETADHRPDIVSLQGFQDWWTIVFGDAFDYQPTWGDNPYERGEPTSHMEGNSYLGTYEKHPRPGYNLPGWTGGNSPTGLLRSDSFTLEADRMEMLVGGGAHPDTCFVAMVDAHTHQLLFTETGTNSFQMFIRLWNLETLIGREVYLVVADLSEGDWGHIAVDSIREYWFSGHGFPAEDPIVDGPTLQTVLENAGYGAVAVEHLPAPTRGYLLNPYPNPFNPRSELGYVLAEDARLTLEIFDIQGRRVRSLLDGPRQAGEGRAVWDGRDGAGRELPSGVYFLRMSLDGVPAESRKLVLLG